MPQVKTAVEPEKPLRTLLYDLGSKSLDETEEAATTLAKVKFTNRKEKKVGNDLVDKGAVQFLLMALRNHPESMAVLLHCMTFMFEISTLDNPEFHLTLTELDGSSYIVDMMTSHQNYAQLQTFGVGILAKACAGSVDSATNVVKNNGIAAVVAAMKAFPEEEMIQQSGLQMLGHVGKIDGAWAARIKDEGGLDAVNSILHTFPKGPIARDAKKTMKILQ